MTTDIVTLPCGDNILNNPCVGCPDCQAIDQCVGLYQGCTHLDCPVAARGCDNPNCPHGM
jgi:hypothetical protein